MAFTKHNCAEDNCSGPKYAGCKIKCHKCDSKVFIECLENFNEFEQLLEMLEITVYDGVSDKTKYKKNCNDKLNKIFKGQTIIFHCSNCIGNEDEADSQDDSQSEIAKLQSIIDSNTTNIQTNVTNIETIFATQKSNLDKFKNDLESAIENVCESLNSLQKNENLAPFNAPNVNTRSRRGKNFPFNTQPSTSTNHNNNNNTNTVNNSESNVNTGLFEIYIAKFETKITCEQIANHIRDKTDTDCNLFVVQMIGGKRKHHNFASFKVTTLDKSICEKILKMNWNPQNACIMSPMHEHNKKKMQKLNNRRGDLHGNQNNHPTQNNDRSRGNEYPTRRNNSQPQNQQFHHRIPFQNQRNHQYQNQHTHNHRNNYMNRAPRFNYSRYDSGNRQNHRENHEYGPQRENNYYHNRWNNSYRPPNTNQHNNDNGNFFGIRSHNHPPRMNNNNYRNYQNNRYN